MIASSRTRRVTTRQQFQAASPAPLSSHMHDFFQVFHQLTFPLVGLTFQVTARHELDGSRRLANIFKCPHCLHCLQKEISSYLTSTKTTSRLLLDGSSSLQNRPYFIRVYWTTLAILVVFAVLILFIATLYCYFCK